MIRKTLTILSLIGLLLSVGLWGASYFDIHYTYSVSERRFAPHQPLKLPNGQHWQ